MSGRRGGRRIIGLIGLVALIALAVTAVAAGARKATKDEARMVLTAVALELEGEILPPSEIEFDSDGDIVGTVVYPTCVSTVNESYAKAWVFPFFTERGRAILAQPATAYFRLGRGRARFIGWVGGETRDEAIPMPLKVRRDLNRSIFGARDPCAYKGHQVEHLLNHDQLPFIR